MDLGSLFLTLGVDPSSYNKGLENAKADAIKTAREIEQILSLQPRFDNKAKTIFKTEVKNISDQIKSGKNDFTLSPTVDHSELEALNDHLDLKRQHFKEVQSYFDSNPLTIRSDLSELDELDEKIKILKSYSRSNSGGSKLFGVFPTQSHDERTSHLDTDKIVGAIRDLRSAIYDVVKAVDDANATSITDTIFEGFGNSIGEALAGKAGDALKRNFKVDVGKMTDKGFDAAAVPVKVLFTENQKFKDQFAKTSEVLGKQLRTAGYSVGDGIVAALESDATTIEGKLEAFIKEAVKPGFKEALEEAGEEAKATLSTLFQSIFTNVDTKSVLQPVSDAITGYRNTALKERAIPLMRERASEILSSKRTKDTANVVDENTKELIIATGGYAGARGLSGYRLSKDLRGELPEGTKIIATANKDTDLPKEAMSDAMKKLQALLTSLGKPNIRGYSKDALEMASQGLAAIERNPEIKIKFLGESGGGFAAEEAAQILKLAGAQNVEYMGVGTPDFIGRLDKSGKNKVMSPDEYLGAETNRLYAPLGLADVSQQNQQVLGVQGHPFEHYKEAGTAELENFLKGSPGKLSKDEITQMKAAAKQFQQTDFSKMGIADLDKFANMALKNMNQVKRYLLDASEDTVDDLQEIVDAFKSVYLRATPEPEGMKQARVLVKRAGEIYAQIADKPGVEAGKISAQALGELQKFQKEFEARYGSGLGTMGAKFKEINEQLLKYVDKFDDPSLLIKKAPPKPPEPPTELIKPGSSPDGGDDGGMGEKIKDAASDLARKTAEAAGELVKAGLEKAGEVAENALVAATNKQLARTADPNTIVLNPRAINKMSDLQPGDYAHLAKLGISDIGKGMGKFGGKLAQLPGVGVAGDALRGLGGAAKAGYKLAQGIETIVLDAIPMGQTAKSVGQNVILPAAAFGATAALPGVGDVAHGAMNIAGHLGGGFGGNVGADLAGNAVKALAGAPEIMGVKALITGAVTEGITSAATAIGNYMAQAALAVTAGRMIQKGVMVPVKAIAGKVGDSVKALPSASDKRLSPSANVDPAIIEGLRSKVLKLNSEVQKAETVRPALPENAQYVAEQTQKLLQPVNDGLDQAITNLSTVERTGTKEGNQLANLKSQVAKLEKKVEQIINVTKFMMENPGESMRRSVHGQTIDVEAINVNQQAQKNAVSKVRDVGKTFNEQMKAASILGKDSPQGKQVAQQILNQVNEARQAIDQMMSSAGANPPKELKEAAKYARQRVSVAESKATELTGGMQNAGEMAAAGMSAGITSSIDEVRKAAIEMAKAAIDATEDELGIQSPSKVFTQIGLFVVEGFARGVSGLSHLAAEAAKGIREGVEAEQPKEITFINGDGTKNVINKQKNLFDYAADATKLFDEAMAGVEKSLNDVSPAFGGLGTNLKFALTGFLAFGNLQNILNFFNQFSEEAKQAAIEAEKMQNVMSFTSGGAFKGQANFNRVNEFATKNRLDMAQAREGFNQFSASTQGTSLEGESTNQIFEAVSKRSKLMQLDPQRQGLVFTALSQMAGKGVISMEELRQQLGESLPGAMNVAARAMNMTVQEFNALVASGQLMSEDFLPKFAQQLEAESVSELPKALDSTQSALTRLDNASLQLKETFGKGLIPVNKLGLDVAATAVETLTKGVTLLGSVLGFVAAKSFYQLMMGSVGLAKAIAAIPGIMALITGAIKMLLPMLMKLLLQFAVFTAAIDVIQMFGKAFSDSAGEFRSFADTSIQGLNDYSKAIDTARKKTEDFKNSQPKPGRTQGESLLEGTALGFIFGKENVRGVEQGVQDTLGLRRFADKQAEDRTIAVNESLAAGDQLMTRVQSDLLGNSGKGINEVSRLKELDKQLQTVRGEKRGISIQAKGVMSPEQADRVRQLSTQERELLDQQSQARKPVAAAQKALQAQIETYKNQIETLEKTKPAGYEDAVERTKVALEASQKQFDKLTAALKGSGDMLGKFINDVLVIEARLSDAQTRTEQKATLDRTDLANADLAGNQTSTQLGVRRALSRQMNVGEQVDNIKSAMSGMQTQLEGQDYESVLSNLGLSKDTGVAELQAVLENVKSPREKAVLEALIKFKGLQNEFNTKSAEFAESMVETRNSKQADLFNEMDKTRQDAESRLKQLTDSNQIKTIQGQSAITSKEARNQYFSGTDAEIARAGVALTSAQNESSAVSQQQSIVQDQINTLKKGYEDGTVTGEEYHNRMRSLTNELSDLRVKKAQAVASAEEATAKRIQSTNAKILEQFDLTVRKREAAITQSANTERMGSRQSLLSAMQPGSGVDIVTAQSQSGLADIGTDISQTEQTKKLIEYQLAETKKLKDARVINEKEFIERSLALNTQLSEQKLKLADLEIAKVKQQQELQLRAIDLRMAKEREASAEVIRGLEAQKNGYDMQSKYLDVQASKLSAISGLMQAQADLAQANAEAYQSGIKSDIDRLSLQIDVAKRYREETDPRKKAALASLGGTADPDALLRQKHGKEAEADQARITALQQQQAMQQKMFELAKEQLRVENKRAELAAKQQQIEAKIAYTKQKSTVREAAAEYQKAKISGDQARMSDAAANLADQKQLLNLYGEQLQFAGYNVDAQKELANISEQKLATEQQAQSVRTQTGINEAYSQASNNAYSRAAEGAGTGGGWITPGWQNSSNGGGNNQEFMAGSNAAAMAYQPTKAPEDANKKTQDMMSSTLLRVVELLEKIYGSVRVIEAHASGGILQPESGTSEAPTPPPNLEAPSKPTNEAVAEAIPANNIVPLKKPDGITSFSSEQLANLLSGGRPVPVYKGSPNNPHEAMYAANQSKQAGLASTAKVQELINNLPGRYVGGSVAGNRAYMVGEKGPEIFIPPQAGNVIPNGKFSEFNPSVNVQSSFSGEGGLVSEFRTLANAIKSMASSPKSIHISGSKEPMQDASKLLSDMRKNELLEGGY